jgi:MarR family transcriptional repressor of emrRAB
MSPPLESLVVAADGDSFSAVDRRIEVTRRRLNNYPDQLVRLARLITHVQKRHNDMSNAVLRPYDLNYVTYTAMMMMYGSEDQTATPSELSDATGEKPTNITRICDELLRKELIERNPSTTDRRRVVLRLTRKGEQLAEQVQPALWQALQQTYGDLSGAELRQLTGLLRRPLRRMEQLERAS